MKRFFAAICFTLTLCSATLVGQEFTLKNTRLYAGYATGRFISIDQAYTKMGLFLPISCCNDAAAFVDGRAYCFNDGKWAASGGLGVRKDFCEWGVVGINAYYDYLRGCAKSNYNQVGVGLEWLHECWDARINGYLPVNTKTQLCKKCNFDQIGNGFSASKRNVEFVYKGLNAELGAPVINHEKGTLYAAAGPYYYHTTYHRFWGGYGRVAMYMGSYISAEVRFSYDSVYKWNAQGYAQLSIPLNFFCSSNCCCSDLLFQPVQRNDLILTDRCCRWKWNWED